MYNKKFVDLNSNQSPSKNPYEISTFMSEPLESQQPEWRTKTCGYERDCEIPQTSTKTRVLTIEDEIRKIHKKTQENRFKKSFKKSCKYEEQFVTCVRPQRTPLELKRHAVMREKFLKITQDMNEVVHDTGGIYADHESIIKLGDPLDEEKHQDDEKEKNSEEGVLKPEIASPQCSMDYIYVPPKRLLELHRPKSGLYLKETQSPNFSPIDEIPYSTYNPRVLQQKFDEQDLKKIDIITGKTTKDLWTWNLGVQMKESELDEAFIKAAVPKFDCNNLDLGYYKIPKDLDKTFTANIVHFNRPTEVACMYIAFVEGFRLNADFWTVETLDNIIKMAEKFKEKCIKLNYKSPDNDYDIIPQITERQASINIKVHFTGPLKSEPNIYKALSLYFSKYNACILCAQNLHLLIWKRCKNFFYIYDCNGRGKNCGRDFDNGKSALISTHFVEHLVHLIVNLSQSDLEDEFNLYEIYLTSYGSIPNPIPKKPFAKTYHKLWAVVNETYAIIPGCNNGIFQPLTAMEQNASMLISIMAILYNHIERAICWKPEQIDELIRLGTAYYKSLRKKLKLKEKQHVTITDLLDKYVLGNFKASLKKSPFFYTATVTDYCKKYQDSLLSSGMKELFDNNWEAALLQIDNSILSVWRDKELYYVYDPFRRGKAGQVLDPEDYKTSGTAVLQMHTNFESCLRIIYQKSLKIRRGGKFFIHAINVGCIKPIMDGKLRKLRYPKLKLAPDTYKLNENKEENKRNNENIIEEEKKDEEKEIKTVKKSKKDTDHKKKPEKVCSIESLDAVDLIPSYEDNEMVEGLLENILCEIITEFREPIVGRPHLYKKAERILSRSDKEYLENMKYLVKRKEDYNNFEMSYHTEPDQNTPTPTLEEELQIPSNFQALLDGSWIIQGSQILLDLNDDQAKLKGLLSALVTMALTSIYKISTWSSQLIDYALNSTINFGRDFQTYHYTLGALLNKNLPKLAIGDRTLQLQVQQILRSDQQKSLKQVLLETLIDSNRLLVLCQRFCCLIMKRYNFLYMFNGFPNNSVGYRTCNPGPGSLLRFTELDPLIRRLEFCCNPQGCYITNYVIIPLKVLDINTDSMGRYRQWPENLEDQMYRLALEEKTHQEELRKTKMRFLNEELVKEDARVQIFQKEKESRLTEQKAKQASIKARVARAKCAEKISAQKSFSDSTEATLQSRERGGQDFYEESDEGEKESRFKVREAQPASLSYQLGGRNLSDENNEERETSVRRQKEKESRLTEQKAEQASIKARLARAKDATLKARETGAQDIYEESDQGGKESRLKIRKAPLASLSYQLVGQDPLDENNEEESETSARRHEAKRKIFSSKKDRTKSADKSRSKRFFDTKGEKESSFKVREAQPSSLSYQLGGQDSLDENNEEERETSVIPKKAHAKYAEKSRSKRFVDTKDPSYEYNRKEENQNFYGENDKGEVETRLGLARAKFAEELRAQKSFSDSTEAILKSRETGGQDSSDENNEEERETSVRRHEAKRKTLSPKKAHAKSAVKLRSKRFVDTKDPSNQYNRNEENNDFFGENYKIEKETRLIKHGTKSIRLNDKLAHDNSTEKSRNQRIPDNKETKYQNSYEENDEEYKPKFKVLPRSKVKPHIQSFSKLKEPTWHYYRESGGQDSYIETEEEETKETEVEEEQEQEEMEKECTVTPKHKFGTKISIPNDECLLPRPILYGYRMREKDLLYKIQGSKALENREICDVKKIKPCLFASTFAILYTILRPLNKWSSQRIDQIIDSTNILSNTLEDMSNEYERILKNVTVDDYKFDIWIKRFEPIGLIGQMVHKLERITKQRKFLLIKTANCCYAVYRDEYFHIFDPYGSMQLMELKKVKELEKKEEMKGKQANKKIKLKLPKDLKKQEEKEVILKEQANKKKKTKNPKDLKEQEEEEETTEEQTNKEKKVKNPKDLKEVEEEDEQTNKEKQIKNPKDLKEVEEPANNKKKLKPPKDIQLYGERNTASWILFADAKSMVKYIDQRACSLTWKEDGNYEFFVVDIISYKKSSESNYALQLLTDMDSCNISVKQENVICAHNESIAWLEQDLPIWSRLNRRNSNGYYRNIPLTKLKKYDIEISKRLWSLWGNIHPQAPVFSGSTRGKQYLACCVLAVCAASLYLLADWSSQLLDAIIINGDRYFEQSIQNINCEDYEFALEDLNIECHLENVKFSIHVEPVVYGKLYSRPNYNRMNLAEGLMYFFNHFQFGILQCFRKCLAIGYLSGHDGGFFMFDCQSRDHPLFPKGQGTSYILRSKHLQVLIYCIVVTLNVPYYNVQFTLHKVDVLNESKSLKEMPNARISQIENDGEEDGN